MPHMQKDDVQTPSTGNLGCLARVVWLFAGHGLIALSLIVIFESEQSRLGVPDAVAWGAVLACLALRYVDVSRLGGMTVGGKSASLADWRRYALILCAATFVIWAIARRTFLATIVGQ